MNEIKCLVWNIEWANPNSPRGKIIRQQTEQEDPDIICYTEGFESNFPTNGNIISSYPNFGYQNTKGKRKVLLWSKNPWTEMDNTGNEKLPPGRFVTGITNGIRIVGVCIPWKDAHVRTGQKNKQVWEDHLTYLNQLRKLLKLYLKAGEKIIVLGDFNQRIPRKYQPVKVFDHLQKVIGTNFKTITENILDDEGKLLIDHISVTKSIEGEVIKIIPRYYNGGLRLSDHVGILASIHTADNALTNNKPQ